MIYTRNDTRNKIFGFAITRLNFDQNAINYSHKLKKFITVSSKVLQTDWMTTKQKNLTNFNLIQPKLFKNKITPLRAS